MLWLFKWGYLLINTSHIGEPWQPVRWEDNHRDTLKPPANYRPHFPLQSQSQFIPPTILGVVLKKSKVRQTEAGLISCVFIKHGMCRFEYISLLLQYCIRPSSSLFILYVEVMIAHSPSLLAFSVEWCCLKSFMSNIHMREIPVVYRVSVPLRGVDCASTDLNPQIASLLTDWSAATPQDFCLYYCGSCQIFFNMPWLFSLEEH